VIINGELCARVCGMNQRFGVTPASVWWALRALILVEPESNGFDDCDHLSQASSPILPGIAQRETIRLVEPPSTHPIASRFRKGSFVAHDVLSYKFGTHGTHRKIDYAAALLTSERRLPLRQPPPSFPTVLPLHIRTQPEMAGFSCIWGGTKSLVIVEQLHHKKITSCHAESW